MSNYEHNLGKQGLGLGLGFVDSDAHSSSNNVLKKKCHLCQRRRQNFFCQDCVEKGNFTHSLARYPERFAEKKLKFYGISEELKTLGKQIEEVTARKRSIIQMKNDVHRIKENIKLYQLSAEETSIRIKKRLEEKEKLKDEIEDQKNRGPRTNERVQKMHRYNCHHQERIKTKKESLVILNSSLKNLKKEKVQMLLNLIFPVSIAEPVISEEIEEINPKESSDSELESLEELTEAQELSFVHGHWVIPENPEVQYKILDAYLPESGNLSEYVAWVLKNKESPSAERICNNPAYRILAGLTHTAQLVAVLAYFLDVKLPKNMCYSEFCGHELSPDAFRMKVAKLNYNIVYLCLAQEVDWTLIRPRCNLKNLLYVFNPETSNLGRRGPVEMNPVLVESMMLSLFEDLCLTNEEEEEEDNLSDSEEWERVPHLPAFEALAIPTKGSSSVTTIVHSQSRTRHNLQTTSTLGEGLMSSVASFWRAATGQK